MNWLNYPVRLLTVLSLLFACWALSLIFAPDRMCLNSKVVSDVTFVWESDSYRVDRCLLLSRLQQPPLNSEDLAMAQDILKMIESLDSLTDIIPTPEHPLKLQFRFDKPFTIKRAAHMIEMGGSIAQAEGQLFKGIIFHWLQQNLKIQDRYPSEVLSDFFSAYLRNTYVFEDPTLELSTDIGPLRWNTYVSTFSDYCLQETRSVLHLEYCLYQNSFDKNSMPEISSSLMDVTIWGFRPFFSEAIWKAFQKTSLSGKSKFLSQALSSFSNASLTYPDSVVSLEDLSGWSKDFISSLVSDIENKEFHTNLRAVLSESGLNHPKKMDFVVYFDSYDQMLITPSSTGLSDARTVGGFFSPQRSILIPSNRPVALTLEDIESRILIYVSCSAPTFNQLTQYNVEKSVVIKNCGKENIDWTPLLSKNLPDFLKSNKQPYVVVHHGSLQLAKKQGLFVTNQHLRFDDLTHYKKQLHWQDLRKITTDSYKPLAAINVITAIRPESNL